MMRDKMITAINIGQFDWSDLASYFPGSPSLPNDSATEALPTFKGVAETWIKRTAPNGASTTLKEDTHALSRYFHPLFQDVPIANIQYEDFALYVVVYPG